MGWPPWGTSPVVRGLAKVGRAAISTEQTWGVSFACLLPAAGGVPGRCVELAWSNGAESSAAAQMRRPPCRRVENLKGTAAQGKMEDDDTMMGGKDLPNQSVKIPAIVSAKGPGMPWCHRVISIEFSANTCGPCAELPRSITRNR